MSDFKDFHKVKNMLFNVSKLKKGLEEVLKIKNYDSANDIPNFAAICLNQVPGDPASTKGNNARGVFWTKPDESGKEVSRDKPIDENLYTEFVKDFEHTYFKEVYEKLSSKFKLGRVRILLKKPRTTLSWHRDPEPRLHVLSKMLQNTYLPMALFGLPTTQNITMLLTVEKKIESI